MGKRGPRPGPPKDVLCFTYDAARARLLDVWVLQRGTSRNAVLAAMLDRWMGEHGLIAVGEGTES